jgi:tRNA G18 (ribose-2'-O)-methylase SpoU
MSRRSRPIESLRAGPGPERFIVEGAVAVARLLASAYEIESIVCTPSQRARLELRPDIPVIELSRSELAELAGFEFHRGVLACANVRRLGASSTTSCRRCGAPIACDRRCRNLSPSRPGVVPGIAAFSGDLLIADTQADCSRACRSEPAWATCSCRPGQNLGTDHLAVERSRVVIAATPDLIAHRCVSAKRILLVGNEGAGLSPRLLALADGRVRIPVDRASDSLNVSAATAVLLYAAQS